MNRLAQQKSPYLLQHKTNPVEWQPWDQQAFDTAKQNNKPIFLSIGYATCHWCHVMAHESFESQDVANVLNQNFVCIKVDREERPDVDDIYMTALHSLGVQGGWPLSMWLTPEAKPFFGGTYFPKQNFIGLNQRIADLWKSNATELKGDAETLYQHLKLTTPNDKEPLDGSAYLESFKNWHEQNYDKQEAGFGRAPKFPQSMNLMLLLRLNKPEMVRSTLTAMLRGGMYDQLHGGFHRYSTDRTWTVPHFEKMLYDQAWLSRIYLEGFQKFKDPEFIRIATEILNYVSDEMTHPQGGFYSAQDADSLDPQTQKMEEGYFATYTWTELEAAFNPDQIQQIKDVYGIKIDGNFEGRNVLYLAGDWQDLKEIKIKLKKLRLQKPLPLTDDKILTAWNGWMISSFALASRTLQDLRFLDIAKRSAHFVMSELFKNDRLYRRFREGAAEISGFSDDYAAMVAALLDIYLSSGEKEFLSQAQNLQQIQDQLFWDDQGLGYFRDDGQDQTLVVRLKDDQDGVRPSSNSLSAMNLLRLYHLTQDSKYKRRAEDIFKLMLNDRSLSMSYLLLAYDFYIHDVAVIEIEGPKTEIEKARLTLAKEFNPYQLVISTETPSPLKIQVCYEGRCLAPLSNIEDLN